MKKYIYFLCIAIICLFTNSCEKSNETFFDQFSPKIDAKNSHVSVIVQNKTSSPRDVTSIDIRGTFVDKKGEVLDVDGLNINGYEITNLKDGEFYTHFNYIEYDNFYEIVKDLTDGTLTVIIRDDDLGDKELKLDVPQAIKIKFPDNFDKKINSKTPFTINWDPGENKEVSNRANGYAIAAINYHAALLSQYNSGLPTANATVSQVEDYSSGQITFSSGQLSSLPENGNVIIYLGTGEQVTFDGDISNNTLTYSTYSASGPVVISQQ